MPHGIQTIKYLPPVVSSNSSNNNRIPATATAQQQHFFSTEKMQHRKVEGEKTNLLQLDIATINWGRQQQQYCQQQQYPIILLFPLLFPWLLRHYHRHPCHPTHPTSKSSAGGGLEVWMQYYQYNHQLGGQSQAPISPISTSLHNIHLPTPQHLPSHHHHHHLACILSHPHHHANLQSLPILHQARQYTKWALVMLFTVTFLSIFYLAIGNKLEYYNGSDQVQYSTTTNTTFASQARQKGSSLRFDWTNLPPMSPLGKIIERSQSRCLNASIVSEHGPQETVRVDLMAISSTGMGSALHHWMNLLCYAASHDMVLVTSHRWEWNDRNVCPHEMKQKAVTGADTTRKFSAWGGEPSSFWCYFGHHESALRCPPGTVNWDKEPAKLEGWRKQTICSDYIEQFTRKGVTTSVTEWLFQNVSQVVINEAERQIRQAFPVDSNSTVGADGSNHTNFERWRGLPQSESLITIHIRWGDKAREMKLCTIDEIINSTKTLLTKDELVGEKDVHIYIVTEDPRALREFKLSSPPTWIVHSSGPKLHPIGEQLMGEVNLTKKMKKHEARANKMDMPSAASDSEGRAGLESLAGLLISLEANRFVLSSESNWSRLIDELRRTVLDLRCNNCTQMIDLRPRSTETWW